VWASSESGVIHQVGDPGQSDGSLAGHCSNGHHLSPTTIYQIPQGQNVS